MVSNPFQQGVSVKINGDSSGLEGAIANAQRQLGNLKRTVGVVGGALGGLAAGGLAASASAAADFDEAMQESVAVMGDIDDAMRDNLEDTARDVAKSTTASHEEAAESFYFLASAGLEAQESMEAMPKVAEFAEAGQMDMAKATDVATNVMSAFGYEADEMTEVTDTLSGTVANHNQTMEGMSSAMTEVAPIASSLGIDIEETSAAIGMLGDVGIQGSKAGVQLRNVFSQLSDETSTASQQLADMGVKVRDSEGDLLEMSDIIGNMADAGVEAGDAAQIFGRRAGPAMAALIEEGGDAMDENTDKIRDMEGATKDIAETQRDTVNAQWGMFKDQLNDIAITIGQNLLPPLTNLLDWVSNAVDSFSSLNDETDGMLGTLSLAATAIGGLGAALSLFIGGPLTLAIGAIAGLATAWAMGWDRVRQVVSNGIDRVVEAFDKILNWFGENGQQLIADGVAVMQDMMGKLASAIETHGPTILNRAVSIFQDIVQVGLQAIQQHGPKLVDAFVRIAESLLQTAANWIQANGPGLMQRAFQAIGRAIRMVLLDLKSALVSGENSVIASLITDAAGWLISNGPGLLKEAAKVAFDGIIAAATGLVSGLIGSDDSTFKSLFGDIASYIKNGAKNLLTGAIDTLIEGVKSGFNYLIGTGDDTLLGDTKSILGDITDWIRNQFDISGALTDVFDGAGDAAAEALKSAFNTIIPDDIGIDEKKVAGQTVFPGATIDLPQLNTGGLIEEQGVYMGHAGERVLNPAETDKLHSLLDGGGNLGGGGVQEVKLVLEERTDIVEGRIEQSAERVVVDQGRATRRNTGRNPNPR